MSDSSASDESVPNLSSYPPAFVTLIEAFIRRAEEAETRAHKALVILKAKDDQALQLQQRMNVLEKIACRLEEVIVPPLELPKSPPSPEDLNRRHPRDVNTKYGENPQLKTLYERFPVASDIRDSSFSKEAHNCYEKCQHLIDGLERSNCQLREALTAESQQRVKDHEQYVETLTKVAQAVRDLQERKTPHGGLSVRSIHTLLQELNLPKNVVDEIVCLFNDTIGSDVKYDTSNDKARARVTVNKNSEDKEEFENNVNMVKSIMSTLKKRLENKQNKSTKRINTRKFKNSLYKLPSKGSLSSYHTTKSCSSTISKSKSGSTLHFLNVLKRKNKELKMKYRHTCEKFTECIQVCQKLQKALACSNLKNNVMLQNMKRSDKEIQTQECFLAVSPSERQKPQGSRTISILQGRLDAAAKVMAKQCKQLQGLQKQLTDSTGQVEFLKKRLARAESTVASKDLLYETSKKQLQESENKCLSLTQELKQMKDTLDRLKQELTLQSGEKDRISKEKEKCEASMKEMKKTLESKLNSLKVALEEKEDVSLRTTTHVESKLSNLREQFVAQVTEASNRLLAADSKIHELYLGIETFLKLLFSLNSPELSPSCQAQAVKVASDILQLPPSQVQSILSSSRCDNNNVNHWIRECYTLVHETVFGKSLGHLLLEAVLDARLA